MENGEHGDGIGGRHDGPKVEDVEEPEGDGDELGEAVHDRRDDEGGDDSPHESEGKDGPDVGEKLAQERKEQFGGEGVSFIFCLPLILKAYIPIGWCTTELGKITIPGLCELALVARGGIPQPGHQNVAQPCTSITTIPVSVACCSRHGI